MQTARIPVFVCVSASARSFFQKIGRRAFRCPSAAHPLFGPFLLRSSRSFTPLHSSIHPPFCDRSNGWREVSASRWERERERGRETGGETSGVRDHPVRPFDSPYHFHLTALFHLQSLAFLLHSINFFFFAHSCLVLSLGEFRIGPECFLSFPLPSPPVIFLWTHSSPPHRVLRINFPPHYRLSVKIFVLSPSLPFLPPPLTFIFLTCSSSPLSPSVWVWWGVERSEVNLLHVRSLLLNPNTHTHTYVHGSPWSCQQSLSWLWPVTHTHTLKNTHPCCSCPSVTTVLRNVMVADFSVSFHSSDLVYLFLSSSSPLSYPSLNPSLSLYLLPHVALPGIFLLCENIAKSEERSPNKQASACDLVKRCNKRVNGVNSSKGVWGRKALCSYGVLLFSFQPMKVVKAVSTNIKKQMGTKRLNIKQLQECLVPVH